MITVVTPLGGWLGDVVVGGQWFRPVSDREQALAAEIRKGSEALDAARTECAELVCQWCRKGKPRAEPVYTNVPLPVRWWHDDGDNDWHECRASGIWDAINDTALIPAEKEIDR